MNKSKFLKKSLAMLLALMLVVAMIPLSASAAAPVLGAGSVAVAEDNGSFSTLKWGENGFTGDISNATKGISLRALIQDDQANAEVWYRDLDQTSNQYKRATDKNNGLWEIPNLSVAKYTQGEAVVVELQVRVKGGTEAEADTYTVTLTPKAGLTDTLISDLVLWDIDQDLPQLGEAVINQTAGTIDVTMPHTATPTTQVYRISSLTLSDATKGATVNYYKSPKNPITTDATPAVYTNSDAKQNTQVENGGVLEVIHNGYTTRYTLNITAASGFESFGFKDDIDTIVFPNENAIAVLLPYGYSKDNFTAKNDVYVTPEFELDYPSASVTWEDKDGKVVTLDGKGTEIYTTDVNGYDGNGAFNDYNAGSTNNTWTVDKANNKTWTEFADAVSFSYAPGAEGAKLTVHYTETSTKTYNVYFFETKENNANEITEVTIGSETATIDGRNINITLPAGSDASQIGTGTKGGPLYMEITASDEAKFSVPLQTGVTISDGDPGTHTLTDTFTVTSGTKLDATAPVIIRVTADDGKAVYDYTLNVTVADSYEDAKITSIYLKAPGVDEPIQAEGDIQNGTILFKVPYTVVNEADLEGYKLFYSKTVGSTITYGSTNTTMPKSGVALTGNDDFIPDVANGNKIALTVTSTAPGSDSANTKTYNLQIDRKDPVAGHTLTGFQFTGTRTYDELTSDLIYDDTTITSNKVTVEIPWSAYQHWKVKGDQFGGQAESNGNSKVFVRYINGGDVRLYPLTEVREDGPAAPVLKDPFEFLYNQVNPGYIDIVVLSERAWVDMEAAYESKNGSALAVPSYYTWGTGADFDPAGDNTNEYTIYDLAATEAPAKTTISPVDLTLVDGAGWTADLTANLAGKAITGTVPYGFISRGNALKPVYLDYDVAERAFVLADDETKSDFPEKDAGVPTSLDGKGVFADYSEYTGTDANFRTNHPYLILFEDTQNKGFAVVKVYLDGAPLTNAADNKLFIVNENGDVSKADLTFTLKIDEPNTGAEFTSFAFKGYENYRGVIDNANDTITVTLPYGTEYTYLTPVYTTSKYASVTVIDNAFMPGDNTTGEMHSGESILNFSTDRRIRVTAENGTDYTTYTVTVKVSDQFTDVNPGDWFYDNVMGAVHNGYMSGMGDGTFGPMKTATRAQFATALACAMGYEAPEDTTTIDTPFIDVDANDWYAGAVNFCYDEGIISGYEDTTFRPDQTITRQEAAAMLNNAFGLEASTDVSQFTDAGKIASWATAHVGAVANAELMNGDAAGTFRPTGTLTRAELASILMNANIHGFID